MICNNSILTIHKKISLRLPKAFRHISFFFFMSLQAFSQVYFYPSSPTGISSCSSLFSFISLLFSTLPCLSGKDTPRAFGASFRRHTAPRTLVLTFFSLASVPLLRLSRTLWRLSLPHTLFHATAKGLSRPPNAPLRYPPSCLLEALT